MNSQELYASLEYGTGGTFEVRNIPDSWGSGERPDFEPATHETGYYVSRKGNEAKYDDTTGNYLTQWDLDGYAKKNKNYFGRCYFGVWKEAERWYLDVTRHFEDRADAIAYGLKNEQVAIWDIANDCAINL